MSNTAGNTATGYTALSLHQPWASLLVHGIKRIEGRAWPCDHRGQLWIHSTSQRPTPEDIQVETYISNEARPAVSLIDAHACCQIHSDQLLMTACGMQRYCQAADTVRKVQP